LTAVDAEVQNEDYLQKHVVINYMQISGHCIYSILNPAVLPTSGKGFLPDQPKNSAADEKIQPYPILSKIG
jgi:hypothetical protein